MSDRAWQFTLRELRRALSTPLLWAALAGISLVLGLTGPFGTYDGLALPGRIAYWALVATTTYFTAVTVLLLGERLLFADRPTPFVHALLGALAGPPVALVVLAINWLILPDPGEAPGIVPLLLYVTAITVVTSYLISAFSHHFHRPAAPEVIRPALLDRLPHRLRGRILFLSMQDHYVEIHTDKGSHLVLMRLADAIAETKGIDGLQIHRSHWVARDAVTAATRRNGRPVLQIGERAELPVSRSYLATVREAGLL